MRKRRRLSRPLHAALCLLAILLALTCVRLLSGAASLMTEKAALRRAQRQSLRVPREAAITVNIFGQQTFVVWDGGEIQTYHAWWKRPFRRGYSRNGDRESGLILMEEPLIRDYYFCYLWRDSRDFGWGCPGTVLTEYSVDGTGGWGLRYTLPLLVKNTDPAVVSGTVTVRGVVRDKYDQPYGVTASALRENPWFFSFLPETNWSVTASAFQSITGSDGSSATAEAEIVWYDENGNELYRQQIELIETEGSEYYGA